jgi:hypothetical protein
MPQIGHFRSSAIATHEEKEDGVWIELLKKGALMYSGFNCRMPLPYRFLAEPESVAPEEAKMTPL